MRRNDTDSATGATVERSPLARALPDAARDALVGAAKTIHLSGGEVLLRAGDRGRDVYIVLTGVLELLGSDEAIKARFVAGDVIGERALLDGGVRSATVRAVRDASVARVPGPAMRRLLEQHPTAVRHLAGVLASRLAAQHAPPAPVDVRSTALVPASGLDRDILAGVAHRLADALRAHGSTIVVDAPRVDAEVGPGAANALPGRPGATAVSAWLDRVELAHRHVVLVAGGGRRWDGRCRAAATTTVVVTDRAHSGDDMRGDALVVVARRGGPPPAGVAGTWRDAGADRVLHLDLHRREEVERLARVVAGTSVGVVLGGGGAKGFAHLGALRAFTACGIPIDHIGGTSIGALFGALWAKGLDHDTCDELAMEKLTRSRRLVGWTLPIVSLSSARTLTTMLRSEELFGADEIADLPNPYFAVSASMTTGRAVVHDRGPLWLATRASISLPGIMPPVAVDGELLVDGGVVNNVPVDVMRERVEGTVIAVNLRGDAPTTPTAAFDPSLSGWRVLIDRLHPRRDALRLPGPATMLLRAKDLGGAQAHEARLATADLVLEPPVAGADNLDFRSGAALAGPAYDATCAALTAWLEARREADADASPLTA